MGFSSGAKLIASGLLDCNGVRTLGFLGLSALAWLCLPLQGNRTFADDMAPSGLVAHASLDEGPLFTDVTGAQIPELAGGRGNTFADIDDDGDVDLIDTARSYGGDHLYLNDGSGTFAIAPGNAGLPANGEGHSVVAGDFDNDGDLDLVIGGGFFSGGSMAYQNNGGTFSNITSYAGIGIVELVHGSALADVDGDGDLDLSFAVDGANKLYVNDGTAQFNEQASPRGLADTGYGITTMFADIDQDGDLDMVGSMASGNTRVYHNDGSGNFLTVTVASGVRDIKAHCVVFADMDKDGDLDLFQGGDGGLYLNDGDGTFTDITATSGVTLPGDRSSSMWADVNNDGSVDLWNGGTLWLNNGDLTFSDATTGSGLESVANNQSVTFADIDGDGDLDMITAGALYRNNTDDANYLIIHPQRSFGSTALNAKVWVYEAGHLGELDHLLGFSEIMGSTARFCGPTPYAHFGLPDDPTVDARVWFLSGAVVELTGVARGQRIVVTEPVLAPRIIYVDQDATPPSNGASWKTAFRSLQNALAIARDGDHIWVAGGTYTRTITTSRDLAFELKSGVGLYGGFNGTETSLEERDWESNLTILSGDIGTEDDNSDNSYHVIIGADNAILDGFNVSDGNANDHDEATRRGGGLYNDGTSPTVRNCTFIGNYALYGGAIQNRASATTLVESCTFRGNRAKHGAAVQNDESSPTITDCVFIGNSAEEQGGAIDSRASSTPTITHCIFSPKLTALKGALMETIDILEKTKNAFKSKDLGHLRKKLEGLVEQGE